MSVITTTAPVSATTRSQRAKAWVIAIAIPLAIILAALLVYRASFAAFTATTETGNNSFSTGHVVLHNDHDGRAVFAETNLVAGATGSGRVVVTYDGTRPAEVRLYTDGTVQAGLAEKITMTVTTARGGTWSGTLAQWQALSAWGDGKVPVYPMVAGGDSEAYDFTWIVATDAPMDANAALVFVWEAQG